jgi:hypothetical protein
MMTDNYFYETYRPFRNFMRGISLSSALFVCWDLSRHLAFGTQLRCTDIGKEFALSGGLKAHVYQWDLEIICREAILHASKYNGADLSDVRRFINTINHLRRMDDAISKNRLPDHSIWREMFRIAHRQFPWQRSISKTEITMYFKLFDDPTIAPFILERTGVDARESMLLGLSAMGHFHGEPTLVVGPQFSSLGIDHNLAQKRLREFSLSVDKLNNRFNEKKQHNENWMYTYSPLRATPLVELPQGNSIFACPMPELILKRITSGLYYDLADSSQFRVAFGFAFERYVEETAKEVTKASRITVTKPKKYKVGKNEKSGVDLIVSDESSTIFIETKTKRIRYDDIFDLNKSKLKEAVTEIADYVVKFYLNIQDLIDGRTEEPQEIVQKLQKFAVLVTLEAWDLMTPDLIEMLDKQIEIKLIDKGVPTSIVQNVPLTIVSIVEFQLLLGVANKKSIYSVLGEKVRGEFKNWRLTEYLLSKHKNELNPKGIIFESDFRRIIPARSTP